MEGKRRKEREKQRIEYLDGVLMVIKKIFLRKLEKQEKEPPHKKMDLLKYYFFIATL